MSRLGVLAYSSQTGLGFQTASYCKHLDPHKVLISDLSQYNLMDVDHSWSPDARITQWPTEQDCQWLTEDIDTLLVAETPLNYRLFELAKAKNVKIIQAYNAEFWDYWRKPDLPKPDIVIAPSSWMETETHSLCKKLGITYEYLPFPTDPDDFPPREPNPNLFVHIIGRPAVNDRNGTLAYLEAAEKLGDRYQHKVFMQTPKEQRTKEYFAPILSRLHSTNLNLEIISDSRQRQELYMEAGTLVLPRRYGGLCLPMQEALSSGMPVIMPDIRPNNSRLPQRWLCDTTGYRKSEHITHSDVDVYEIDINVLAETMQSVANDKHAPSKAIEISQEYSWPTLKQKYLDLCG